MIANTENNISFIDGLEGYIQSLTSQAPSWLNDIRKYNIKQFYRLGVPTFKDEEWKYTNISPIIQHRYRLPQESQLTDQDSLKKYYDPHESNIILVDGHLDPHFSLLKNLPQGIRISSLKEAIDRENPRIKELLKKSEEQNGSAFLALNKALSNQGIYIQIDDKTVFEQLIHIIHITNDTGKDIISSPRTMISLGKSSEATILESHLSFQNDLIYFTNSLTEIFLSENSTLLYCKAQGESLQAYHIGSTSIWQERNSNFNSFFLSTGGNIARHNLNVFINGEGAHALLNGLYSVSGKQLVDNHTAVDHRFPNCTSNQLYKGILNGESHAVFNGKIFVQPIAQLTNSYQLNKNLILGKECRVDTKPQLEIFADDVKCTHGATIGQLNEDEIFYFQSRGVSKKIAVKMLSRGFVDDIINTIPNNSICRKLNYLLEPTFQALE